MKLPVRRGLFEDFFEHRSYLIMQYNNKDITKREFIERNFNYFNTPNSRPFLKVDSYEKGMYNYQYYNGLAKYYRMLAKEIRFDKSLRRTYNDYLNLSNKYYNEKDQATLQILNLQEFQNCEAYFIKMESEKLKNKLYEIVLNDKKEAILHSKAPWLLKIIRDNGIFSENLRNSLISDYINERY